MCGRYVITNPVSKTKKIVKSAIQVEDNENYNAHPYQKLPVIKKYINGNTLENLTWGIIPSWSKKKDFKPLTNARLETIDEKTLPEELEVTARSESGVIMGVRHKNYDIEGIQFHPESIFTENGKEMINNFLNYGK